MILNLMAASSQICYNLLCKDPKSDSQRKKGWRIRSGEHAQLCDRCYVAYEQGTFCEIFHAEADGWRKCEACGKRVHCGCIVSASFYVLLDAGGINCVMCARKSLPLGSSNAWSPTLLSYQMSDRLKEQPVRNWSQMAGSYPGQWRQGHLWNTGAQSDLQQRLSLEFDRPLHSERRLAGICPPISMQDKKVGDLSSLNHVKHNMNPTSTCNSLKEEHNNLQESSRPTGENDRSTKFSVVNFETHKSSHAKMQSTEPELSGLRGNLSSHSTNDQVRISVTQSQQQLGSMMSKQVSMNSHNINDASIEPRGQKSRSDARSQAHLLSRYQPRITDQELQQISGDSNSVITPLFEKILSVSDAGRIGRLVLPKKCAETYFPPITHTEGLPLKVQDCNGKEWGLQFRFWPNNKSRMYVLEGITPCIQSMQLVAGDTVTFSRIDPEGKLVMGFRKAAVLPDQDAPLIKTGNGLATASDGNNAAPDNCANVALHSQDCITEPPNPASTTGHFDKSDNLQKDGSAPQPIQGPKRRGRKLGSKSKRLRINNNDAMELSLTWEEAQELLRPPPTIIPITVVLDDHEIEEYEEAPVFGKPTIFTSDQAGEISQWAQCDDCFKWRKLPVDALLPSRFSCAVNKWDLERISCSSPQVANTELTDLLHKAGLKWSGPAKSKHGSLDTVKSLDTENNLGRPFEGDESSQQTTKHPRHRPGCTCIVCIQPPSCRGTKHNPTCTCNVCIAVRRRYQSLIQRREKRQFEKDIEAEIANGVDSPLPQNNLLVLDNENDDEDGKRVIVPSMTSMAKIDLNIQPEREEEISPVPDVGNVSMPFADAVV